MLYDKLANVTATDKEDGTITLTKDNIVANDVDTSKAGTYHVTYKVTDKNGASVYQIQFYQYIKVCLILRLY